MRLKIPRRVQHGARLQIGLSQFGRQEIRTYSFAQVTRLAHVNDAVKPVAHQVHTGFVRHFVHFLLQVRLLFSRCSHPAATYLRIRREEIAVECALLSAFNPGAPVKRAIR